MPFNFCLVYYGAEYMKNFCILDEFEDVEEDSELALNALEH